LIWPLHGSRSFNRVKPVDSRRADALATAKYGLGDELMKSTRPWAGQCDFGAWDLTLAVSSLDRCDQLDAEEAADMWRSLGVARSRAASAQRCGFRGAIGDICFSTSRPSLSPFPGGSVRLYFPPANMCGITMCNRRSGPAVGLAFLLRFFAHVPGPSRHSCRLEVPESCCLRTEVPRWSVGLSKLT
jgi:hypothetical protein